MAPLKPEAVYFIADDDDWAKWHRYWIDWCRDWLVSVGIPAAALSEYNHPKEKLAFYSKGTTDLMFKYPFGVQELWGIAARGDYDLTQHGNASGQPMAVIKMGADTFQVPADRLGSGDGVATINMTQAQISAMLHPAH